MPRIQQLSSSVVNKIAAGEVIERPASVVKELLENAVDAGGGRIDVSLEGGGAELIRVRDDGCGIDEEQLTLALASHATSKIVDADDLFAVGTLGFRGEALASIAEVSRLTLRSRTADSPSGAEVEVIGGEFQPLAPCSAPVGTTVEARNLFFNTPVRRKFMRATQTEMSHCSEAFTRLALAHPAIHFTLTHNNRTLHDLPPSEDWRTRIRHFFGDDLADGLIPIESREGPIRVAGLVANPSHSRGNNRWQYLFLNGRAIRDRALQHALSEAYRGLILTGRYPVSFLRFEMPADEVDVNVHPTKLEVRFQDSGRLYSQLLGTLREKFLTTDLTARLQPGGGARSGQSGGSEAPSVEAAAAEQASSLVNWAKEELAKRSEAPEAPGGSPGSPHWAPSPVSSGPLRLNPINIPPFRPFDGGQPLGMSSGAGRTEVGGAGAGGFENASAFGRDWQSDRAAPGTDSGGETPGRPQTDIGSSGAAPGSTAPLGHAALQMHNRYLVAETENGMVVIDQHALHERILYEALREKVLAGSLESQNLLVPEPVDLSPAEAAAVLENQYLLAQLGMQVEAFGGQTILVSSYPAMLSNINPAETLRDLADKILAEGKSPEARDVLDEMLHMISCKAAIKAGDHLTPEEVTALVGQRHLVQDSHHCPHGRPTALEFTRDELDRQFKRT